METKSQVELCLADRSRCRAQVAGADRYWTEADGSWGYGRDWRGRNPSRLADFVPRNKIRAMLRSVFCARRLELPCRRRNGRL